MRYCLWPWHEVVDSVRRLVLTLSYLPQPSETHRLVHVSTMKEDDTQRRGRAATQQRYNPLACHIEHIAHIVTLSRVSSFTLD